ncbi:MAG: branched-chain amino acid transaminase [Candidatus Obscuribacter sp.]|jgi:branched-chain amino acid aminotransferase|nr:branched-chain amino acid transaminase [Candidatus Obscuribacter sp.]MBK7836447.1 branched-chain amino acid transaminase [Candidatus Obscuribacter sp.]MBK9617716.1 branched-chain amino acid transaminase [Candidatus Obscuribacter sp.]MBK9774388.1 branched-chain amino acid transaminase [Candidatus Obscuribacter sp.]MBP7579375.1 branched-chain amino acid transaminase [Candidatus Obscuribacter sp.]
MADEINYAFFEGGFVPLQDAKLSIMNHSFMYGTAVFEGIRGYWNPQDQEIYVFRLREHFERMADSMKIMYLGVKYSVDELCDIVIQLLQKNAPKTDTYVRPCAYKTVHRVGPSLENNPSDMCIFSVPFGDYFHGAPGLKVQVSSWRRVEDNAIPARAKIVGAYANTALAKTDAIMAGFDECIVLSENGHVSEGSAMNVFIVKNGRLITTPSTENILEGVTRSTIMTMAEEEFGIKAECRTIDRSELYIADEVFFCGTGAQIAPVIEIDRRPIGSGSAGPISTMIKDKYIQVCRGEIPKYHHWLTPVYKNTKVKSPA